MGAEANLDDEQRQHMGASWPLGSSRGYLLSYGALNVLAGGDPTSESAGIRMEAEPSGSGKLIPKPMQIRPRAPATGVVKRVAKHCLARLVCPHGRDATCATRSEEQRSKDRCRTLGSAVSGKSVCCGTEANATDCRSCGHGMDAQIACCLALSGVYSTAMERF